MSDLPDDLDRAAALEVLLRSLAATPDELETLAPPFFEASWPNEPR